MSSSEPELLSCDVLIVGGGPAGLSVTSSLPSEVQSIVVHQDKEVGKPVRTSGGSWVKDLRDLNVPRHLYKEIGAIEFHSDNFKALTKLKKNKAAVLDVTGLYKWLAEQALKKNCSILTDTKYLSSALSEDGAHYISKVRGKENKSTEVVSNFIVDASGSSCSVLHSMGISTPPNRVGIGMEYEFESKSKNLDRAILFVGSLAYSGYGWIFPAPKNKIRVGVGVIQPDTQASPRELVEKVLNSSVFRKFEVSIGDLHQVNAGIIPSTRYDKDLVFGKIARVGDSANFATPTVGEGIRISIKFGKLLGQCLGEALCSNSSAPLENYESLCRKEFLKNYRFGFLANNRITRYRAAEWDRSVKRLSKLSEEEVVALLRSEFSPAMIFPAATKYLRSKVFGERSKKT